MITTSSNTGKIASDTAAPSDQQAGADADLVGVGGEQVRRVCRSAAGQHVDELEIGEGLDHREQHDDHRDRQQQRPGHVAEAVPGARAVDRRRLVQFGADRLQPGQQADRVKRHAAPDIDDHDRDHREVRIAEPVDPAGDDVQLKEHPVQHAEGRVEHPFPGEGRQHGRDDERQQDEGADERLAAEMPVEQQRQPQAEHQFEDRRDERVEEGVVDRDMEDAVVPQLLEIGEADEMALDADLGVGDREQHALDERVGDEQAEQHDRRQQQHEASQRSSSSSRVIGPRRGRAV